MALTNGAGAVSNGSVFESALICGNGTSELAAVADLGYQIYLAHDIFSKVSQDEHLQAQLDFFNDDGDYVRSMIPNVRMSWDGWLGQDVYQACVKVR